MNKGFSDRSLDNKKNSYAYPTKEGKDYGFEVPRSNRSTPIFNPRDNQPRIKSNSYMPSIRKYHSTSNERDLIYESQTFVKSSTGINFQAYDNIPVNVKGGEGCQPMQSFKDLDLGEVLNLNVELCGFDKPTPIQKHGIPHLINGRDLMACAQTGSGKTAAYLLPIIHKIHTLFSSEEFYKTKQDNAEPYALIMAPTRELARQIEEDARRLTYRTHVKVIAVYGGVPVSNQAYSARRGCDILVATPGRLNDMINQGVFTLKNCQNLVLDEADRMLDMGFEPQIRRIIESSKMPIKSKRQTIMFSATFPSKIRDLARDFLNNEVNVNVGRVGAVCDNISQKIILVPEEQKLSYLKSLLAEIYGQSSSTHALVFVDRKLTVDYIESQLFKQYKVVSIHGDRNQIERDQALSLFKSRSANIMIATDVAQRGLDIPNVTHVINYSFPTDIEDYVHRIGRTGRAGNSGASISFFNEMNSSIAHSLIKVLEENKQDIPSFLQGMTSLRSFSSYNSNKKYDRDNRSFGNDRYQYGFRNNRSSGDSGYKFNKDNNSSFPTRRSNGDSNFWDN